MPRMKHLVAGLFAAIFATTCMPAAGMAKANNAESFLRYNVRSSLANAVTSQTPANVSSNSNSTTASQSIPAKQNTPATIDTSNASKGYVSVAYYNTSKKLKGYISLGGRDQFFSMRNDGNWTNLPLTLGSGTYEIRILENTTGTKYGSVTTATAAFSDNGAMDRYLKSIPTMEYDAGMASIKKAAALSSGKSEADKVAAMYEYVVLNTSYDYDKLNTVQNGYEPNIEDTFASRKGICYDYAALFGAMCRSQGIPAKMVKGYASGVQGYHAWNAVYVGGQWRVIDTTADAVYRAAGQNVSMYKNNGYVKSIVQEY